MEEPFSKLEKSSRIYRQRLLANHTYFEHIVLKHTSYYPAHAFSKGQLASKSWLLKELNHTYPKVPKPTIAILGSWIGALVEPLHKSIPIERIYGIDTDAEAIEKFQN